jgi:stalled ribosome alternative rescue factor ArfA
MAIVSAYRRGKASFAREESSRKRAKFDVSITKITKKREVVQNTIRRL